MTAFPDLDDENDAKPVFVDPTGRRRRIVRRVALAACAGLLLYLAVFVAALFGAPIPPSALIPVPGVVPEQATSTAPPPATGEPTRAIAVPRTPIGASAAEPTSAASGSRPVTTTSAVPPATTTTAPVTTDRRNTHAPATPPGQARTTPPGNGH